MAAEMCVIRKVTRDRFYRGEKEISGRIRTKRRNRETYEVLLIQKLMITKKDSPDPSGMPISRPRGRESEIESVPPVQ
jgi:hypothetical protein